MPGNCFKVYLQEELLDISHFNIFKYNTLVSPLLALFRLDILNVYHLLSKRNKYERRRVPGRNQNSISCGATRENCYWEKCGTSISLTHFLQLRKVCSYPRRDGCPRNPWCQRDPRGMNCLCRLGASCLQYRPISAKPLNWARVMWTVRGTLLHKPPSKRASLAVWWDKVTKRPKNLLKSLSESKSFLQSQDQPDIKFSGNKIQGRRESCKNMLSHQTSNTRSNTQ